MNKKQYLIILILMLIQFILFYQSKFNLILIMQIILFLFNFKIDEKERKIFYILWLVWFIWYMIAAIITMYHINKYGMYIELNTTIKWFWDIIIGKILTLIFFIIYLLLLNWNKLNLWLFLIFFIWIIDGLNDIYAFFIYNF